MPIEHKEFLTEVKELNDKGEGVLRFIKFNQEDKDSDITLSGFIGRQEAVLLASHNWKSDEPPLGRGESFEADGATNFRFKLNPDDPRAQRWRSWLRMDQASGRPLQQISYGFSIYEGGAEKGMKDGRPVRYLKPKPDGSAGAKLHELSFVVVGSGNDTAVLGIKSIEGFEDVPEPEEMLGSFDDLKQGGVRIQTLIFPRSKWDSADAVRSWLSSHDYSTTLDTTENSYRARQRPPGDFQRLRSFCINPSREASSENCRIMAVGGPMKESRSMADEPGSVVEVKRVITPHSTPTDDRAWNFAIEHRAVKTAMGGGFYRNLFAVQDPGKESQRSNYRYLHHRVTADGEPGSASIVACSQILHALHKGLIPPDERKGVYEHMAQHLRDAGIEPPSLGDPDSYVYPYDEEAKLFLWHVDDILQQTGNIHTLRAKRGMSLTQERLDQFERMDQKWVSLRTLLSVKGLDKPYDAIVEQMTVEARGEALADRVSKLVEARQERATRAERDMTDAVVARLIPKLSQ